MTYGKYHHLDVKAAPKFLGKLGIKPVYFPRQDGVLEHYAFLSKDGSVIFTCVDLEQLVKEADKMHKESKKKVLQSVEH